MRVYESDFGPVGFEDAALGRGGRGRVMPLAWTPDGLSERSEDLVLKEVERRYRTTGRREKVRCLSALGRGLERADGIPPSSGVRPASLPKGCAVAWPLASVYEEGEWAGFIMRKMEGRPLDEVKADEESALALRLRLARRMSEMLSALHALGVVVGDVSLSNFVYDKASDRLALIDIDSAQVLDAEAGCLYPTTESRERSPEMIGGQLGDVVLSSRSDDFLLAVEVFRLLFDAHPLDEYKRDVPPAQARMENARDRRFGFTAESRCCTAQAFGEELGRLFEASFEGPYELVPSAAAYAACLRDLEDARFEACPSCGGPRLAPASEKPQGRKPSPEPAGNAGGRKSGASRARKIADGAFRVCACLGVAAATALLAVVGASFVPEALSVAESAVGEVAALAEGALEYAGEAAGEAGAFAEEALDVAGEVAAKAAEGALACAEGAFSFASDAAGELAELAEDAWDWLCSL